MRTPALLFVLCALPLGAGCSVLESGEGSYGEVGPYVGAQFGLTFEDFDVPSPLDVEDSTSTSFGAKAGYRIHKHVAAELAFEYLSEYDVEVFGTTVGELDGWTLMAQAKGYLTDGIVQPFGLFGIGIFEAELKDSIGGGFEEDETDLHLKFGAGADVWATQNFGGYIEGVYNVPTDDLDDLNFWNLNFGVVYKF